MDAFYKTSTIFFSETSKFLNIFYYIQKTFLSFRSLQNKMFKKSFQREKNQLMKKKHSVYHSIRVTSFDDRANLPDWY